MNAGEVEGAHPRGGPCAGSLRDVAGVWGWAVLAAAALIGSRYVLKHAEMPEWGRFLVALTPVPPFAGMLWVMVRSSRRLDEMWARVQLEALGGTVVLGAGVFTAWGQLQKAGFMEVT